MKANFETCLAAVLKYEGGFVDHPRDPGGPTNMGVTIATLSHELGRAATREDVKKMSRELAASIYRKKYWNLIGADELPEGVDLMLFDIAVNSGPGRALAWDKQTRALAPLDRLRALDARRRSFYRGLKTFPVFGRGWMARESDVFARASAMARRVAPLTALSTKQPAQERIISMKGYRTYVAAGLVSLGGLMAQTDWISFLANPQAGLVALGSGALMAVMRSVTTTAPGAAH